MPESTQKEKKTNTIYSRPIFKQTIKINSLQAQRVMNRNFKRISRSLYSISVILRIVGKQQEIDNVEHVINDYIMSVSNSLDAEMAQLKKLMNDNGIDSLPGYTNPSEYTIEINSPFIAQFIRLVCKLDKLMGIIDTLWLNTILNSKQHSDATFEWQQKVIKMSNRIIEVENKARNLTSSPISAPRNRERKSPESNTC